MKKTFSLLFTLVSLFMFATPISAATVTTDGVQTVDFDMSENTEMDGLATFAHSSFNLTGYCTRAYSCPYELRGTLPNGNTFLVYRQYFYSSGWKAEYSGWRYH